MCPPTTISPCGDKLLLVRYERPEFGAVDRAALAQNRLAAGIYLTCMGLPFWQAGEEFARTKKGQGNSYRSSPALNRLDWKRAEQFHAGGLLPGPHRAAECFPRLGAVDRASPNAIAFFDLEQPLVGWRLPACPAMGRGGAHSASTTTPPNRNSPSGCRRTLEAAERRHLVQPVAGRQPHPERRSGPGSGQCDHLRPGINSDPPASGSPPVGGFLKKKGIKS